MQSAPPNITSLVLPSHASSSSISPYFTRYYGDDTYSINGVGIDRIAIGDLQIYYDTGEYEVWETLAQQMLIMNV